MDEQEMLTRAPSSVFEAVQSPPVERFRLHGIVKRHSDFHSGGQQGIVAAFEILQTFYHEIPAWKQYKRDSDYEDQIVFSKAVQDLDFNRLDSLTDSIFDAALNRKCGIGEDALERLKLYYQNQNITDSSCYNELVQFDKDLNNENYYAQERFSNRNCPVHE